MARTRIGQYISRVCFSLYVNLIVLTLFFFSRELAVALQNEEQRRFHEEQSRQQQRYPQQVPYDGLQKRSNRKVKPSEYDDYDDGCTCILL